MRRRVIIGTATLSAAVVAASAGAAPALPPELTRAQVLHFALREARLNGDPHPTQVLVASGRLSKAFRVFDPESGITPGGLAMFGGASLRVDLVVERGHFTSSRHPKGTKAPKGTAMEFVIDARSGSVLALQLAQNVRVALSHLGRVTRLR